MKNGMNWEIVNELKVLIERAKLLEDEYYKFKTSYEKEPQSVMDRSAKGGQFLLKLNTERELDEVREKIKLKSIDIGVKTWTVEGFPILPELCGECGGHGRVQRVEQNFDMGNSIAVNPNANRCDRCYGKGWT